MEMTGEASSTKSSPLGRAYDNEFFLSPDMDLRTDVKFIKDDAFVGGGDDEATAVDGLPGPKGKRLRRARRAGIPEAEVFAEDVGGEELGSRAIGTADGSLAADVWMLVGDEDNAVATEETFLVVGRGATNGMLERR
jgi:hypothetical protein